MKIKSLSIIVSVVLWPSYVSALLLDVYESPNLTTAFGNITTIDTAQTGAQHYNYFSASAHPTGVNLGTYNSSVWVHEDTNNPGNYSFGFVFSIDNSSDSSNQATINFRIVDSLTDVFVSQSDDPGEAIESSPGTFQGTFNYGLNTDGIMVSGITGNAWTIIIDSVDFGDITDWYASSGDGTLYETDLPLTLGNEYRITPAGNPVSGAPVLPVPEPTTLALMGLGLAGLGFRRKINLV